MSNIELFKSKDDRLNSIVYWSVADFFAKQIYFDIIVIGFETERVVNISRNIIGSEK